MTRAAKEVAKEPRTKRSGWTTVRIRDEMMDRLKKASDALGGVGPNYILERAVADVLDMAATEASARRTPMLVRLLDGAAAEGAPVADAGASAPTAEHRRGAHRVGQG